MKFTLTSSCNKYMHSIVSVYDGGREKKLLRNQNLVAKILKIIYTRVYVCIHVCVCVQRSGK